MQYTKRKLLSIITEAALEPMLVHDLKRLGAQGYTIWDARGEGARGVRAANWEQNRNICVQVICDEQTADAIAQHLFEQYYADYAMVLRVSDVDVLRPDKF